jgi:peptide/nickel transport system permease protein
MSWVLRRIGVSVGLVWVVASVVFLAIHFVPGDPAEVLLSLGGSAPSPESVRALRSQLGLDQPVLTQYALAMLGLIRGDLGRSLQDGASVAAEIGRRLPRTLELIAAAGAFGVAIGMPLGVAAAVWRGSAFDRACSVVSGVALSVPVFVLGTVLILVFAQTLRWVAAGGYVAPGDDLLRHLATLAMPATAIGVGLAGTVLRIGRAAVLDVLQRDHVRAARAKGLGERAVLWRHVVRNAWTPVVTVVALNLGSLLGGTVLVEYVFNWPGLSGLLVDAVNGRDYPVVVGCILVISILFVSLNLAVDLLYGILDPKVRR